MSVEKTYSTRLNLDKERECFCHRGLQEMIFLLIFLNRSLTLNTVSVCVCVGGQGSTSVHRAELPQKTHQICKPECENMRVFVVSNEMFVQFNQSKAHNNGSNHNV